jgi:hypothetical protein
MSVRASILSVAICAALAIPSGRVAFAQSFGGSPPWGPEKPILIRGELRQGQTFEYPIGNGLSLTLTPNDEWELGVAPSSGGDDYSGCVNEPVYGPKASEIMAWHFQPKNAQITPGGVGQKRWFDFVLSSEDNTTECNNLDIGLHGRTEREKESALSEWGTHVSGRCWFRPVSVKLSDGPLNQQVIESMKFEAECALHGALELWRLPATYVIADGFTGWVTVYYRQKGQPELPRRSDRYLVEIGKLAAVYTSSDLREDSRGAKYASKDGKGYATHGHDQMIWGWEVGDAESCSPYQSFFVGTGEQYRKSGPNPVLENPEWDCSKVMRVER